MQYPEDFLNKVICGNNIELLREMPDKSVKLCVTSPPYKTKDGYSNQLILDISHELYRVLKDNSLCFVNFGHLKEDKFRPFNTCSLFLTAGFKLADTIIWKKNHFTPLRGNNLNNLTEFIFMLYKGEMPDIDRLSIGIPYQDPSNAKRYNNGQNLRCRGNLWEIDIPTITSKTQRLHKDEFPIELPLNCIKLANMPDNSIIIDPFAGSGTTLLAAKQLNKQYIGFEISQKYCNIAQERLKY